MGFARMDLKADPVGLRTAFPPVNEIRGSSLLSSDQNFARFEKWRLWALSENSDLR
jgi:hypothetical protein